MGRVFIASLVGAAVVFVWGWIAWGMLGIYDRAFQNLPNEGPVVAVLETSVPQTGAYFFPGMPADTKDTTAMNAWKAKHRAGPVGMLLYRAQGAEPMPPSMMVRGFLMYFVACLLMGCIMFAANMTKFSLRLGLAIIMAAFAVMITHASNWNWFMFPNSYATALAIDVMIAWTLGGICVAGLVKPYAPGV